MMLNASFKQVFLFPIPMRQTPLVRDTLSRVVGCMFSASPIIPTTIIKSNILAEVTHVGRMWLTLEYAGESERLFRG